MHDLALAKCLLHQSFISNFISSLLFQVLERAWLFKVNKRAIVVESKAFLFSCVFLKEVCIGHSAELVVRNSTFATQPTNIEHVLLLLGFLIKVKVSNR